jgi:hypothetical protein
MTVPVLGLSVAKLIQSAIEDDPDLMSLLTGGVYTRPIARDMSPDPLDPTQGATPDAFDTFGRIKPCISIRHETEEANTQGPPGGMWTFPMLFIRTQPKDSEKAKLEQIFILIRRALHKKHIAMPTGTGGTMRVAGRMGPIDDIAIQGAVVMSVQLQIDGVWEVLPNE